MSTAPSTNGSEKKQGLTIKRTFSDPHMSPFAEPEWSERTAEIKDEKGNYVYKQEGCDFPDSWSDLAVNVVASKYFYGDVQNGNGSPADGKREYSVQQLIHRVVHTLADWGDTDGYFDTRSDADAFHDELAWLLLNQYGAFNSPVWFNVGLWDEYKVEGSYDGYYFNFSTGNPEPVPSGRAYQHPAGSACFILGVEDSIPSIYDRVATEGRIFKYGSGCGTNNSSIRSSREVVSGGGKPSGPLSFMTVYDAVAKVTKSGGKVRRAAKMEILDDWHPDILEFIRCKGQEEAKAHALIREGYESNFNGEAYTTVCFQNSNMSVRFSDAFMAKVDGNDPDKTWQTKAVTTGTAFNARNEQMPVYDVDMLIDEVAAGTWHCGDPGVHFTDTIQKWHTCKATGPLRASNPCCFVGDTEVCTDRGRISIGMLASMDSSMESLPNVYGFDTKTGLPVLRPIKRAWIAGTTRTIAIVKTASGMVFESTFDHRYLTRDNGYIEAGKLTPGTHLRTLNLAGDFSDIVQEVTISTSADHETYVYDIEVDDVHNFSISYGKSTHGIVVSNSEFLFLDGTACNLACLNLAKFVNDDGSYNVDRFRAACRIFFIAQEIIVDRAGYPTAEICQNSHDFRPLGLGYTNLGALLMSQGMPYDSDEGRAYAASITAVMHGQANLTSTELAQVKGPFKGYLVNHKSFREVMALHQDAVYDIADFGSSSAIKDAAKDVWASVFLEGGRHGFRNAQATLLQPCGTTGFMLDNDTTGVEPDLALVKYKKLAGGGMLKIVNRTVPIALGKLGYRDEQIRGIVEFIEKNDTIEGAPFLKAEHLPVFDCAFAAANGERAISWKGHIDMMASVQPFLAGAISKTANVPEHFSTKDIRDAYVYAWKKGLKCVAIYRENSKASQPLNTKKDDKVEAKTVPQAVPAAPQRKRLPDTRNSLTHKFSIGGHEGYLTVGLYPDGVPGELFVTMAKEGSTVGGLMDQWATAVSIGLQYGVPLDVFASKFAHSRYEPSGFTKHDSIRIASSLTDYIARFLELTFLPRPGEEPHVPISMEDFVSKLPADRQEAIVKRTAELIDEVKAAQKLNTDSPVCSTCGGIMQRAGTCHTCTTCGSSSGCSG